MTDREIIAKAIHDGPEAVYQHWQAGIPFHEWEDCPHQRQYLADADAVLAAGYSRTVGTGAGEGATGQDTGTAWVTRSMDCPEAPAQAHCAGLAAGAFTARKPEPEPLKVGDVLETVEDLRRFAKLPAPAFATDRDGDGWCSVLDGETVRSIASDQTALDDVVRYAPFTIRYIPEVNV